MTASLRLTAPLIRRWGLPMTLLAGMVTNGIGLILLAAGMSVHGSFWAVVPGLVVWGIGAGTTFPAMFAAAASGVSAAEQGVASALAATSQQIGGAVGLAGLVAVANFALTAGKPATSALVAGQHLALLTAGVATVLAGLLALVMKGRTPTPSRRLHQQNVTSTPETAKPAPHADWTSRSES
ncbi:MFS transporter [Fodinicola feengrottensis]